MDNIVLERLKESIDVKKKIMESKEHVAMILLVAKNIVNSYRNGGKVLLCGNGGSASDALHITGELVGRFQKERKSWPAISLNADVASMTAIANDYGYDEVFARQTQGLMNKGDLLIGITTSGNSKNIINAFNQAKIIGGITIALTGRDGGYLKEIADYSIIVPSNVTARIQESHITIGHIICEIVEDELTKNS